MRRNRNERVTVSMTIEVDVEVECEVSPGEPCVMWGDNAHPGSGPEVEILSVKLDVPAAAKLPPGGITLPDDVLSKSDIERIEEAALEQAADAAIAAEEEAAEARAEARAERRREEGW